MSNLATLQALPKSKPYSRCCQAGQEAGVPGEEESEREEGAEK